MRWQPVEVPTASRVASRIENQCAANLPDRRKENTLTNWIDRIGNDDSSAAERETQPRCHTTASGLRLSGVGGNRRLVLS